MPDLLAIVTHEFARHRTLAERAMEVLGDEQFFHRPAPTVNPVALIVKHMAGNLRARWSDPFGGDGEPASRNRDGEFELAPTDTRESLMSAWDASWTTLESTVASLRAEDLDRTIPIRGEPHTMAQALMRGATHASYHVGQILYVARLLAPDSPYLTAAPRALRAGDAPAAPYLTLAPRADREPSERSAPSTPMVRRVLETALYVDDVDRAVKFYTSVLGLRLMGQAERMASVDAGSSTVLLLFRRGASIGGIPTEGGAIPPHDGAGPWHLAFAIDAADFESWLSRLEQTGVAVESVVHWPRGGRSVYFRDPDGHSVEFATPGVWQVY